MTLEEIFTGGLQTALEIEAEKSRAKISNPPIAQENTSARKGDSGTVYRAGSVPSIIAGVSPVMLIGAGAVVLLLVVLLLRRG